VSLKDETEVHKNAISLLRYNQTGSRMVTTDVSGMICVWRGLTTLSKYQRQDFISQCCFAELNLDLNQKLRNLFFLGGTGGIVTLADDSNHLSEICKVSGSIIALQFYSVFS
jgi:intraflagellar transport protein 140